ncbi:nitric oxide synthase, inducible [Trichonephila clavipes]|nr:nitric oxide synthase, inducible [Trichonephila clavipes]
MLIEKIPDFNVPAKCPFSQTDSGVKLTNYTSGKRITDVLHSSSAPIKCDGSSCKGSLMTGQSTDPGCRSKEQVLEEALKFQEMFLSSMKASTPEDLTNRMNEITEEVVRTGTYNMKLEEMAFGAKMAWRNASRCIGRIQWNKLHVNDCRHVTTTQEMFEGICKHLEYATNGGNIRSTITLFPPRIEGREDFRVWNPQLINFAGYLQPDGSILGDPGRLQFTRVCQRLGWRGKGGKFDILPLVVSAPGEGVKCYDLPEELVMTLDIEHPKHDWFKELGIRWYAVPAVSEMMLDMGGLCFTAAPFNGWYMATEIGARNLCDIQRYNIAKEVAEKMGLDTMTHTSLWKDIALVETTLAVLHSFQKNKITIVDHHTAADTFMKHMETELNLRGGCPADWVWIVPPISGSSTPVFHQEMINYNLKPSYEYQEKAWITYKWPKNDKIKLKYSFASVIKVVRLCLQMMAKVRSGRTQTTILYASETGKSETFAKKLGNVLHASFNTKVMCMDDYETNSLTSEDFIIVVASTFGSGEPPDNGQSFWKALKELKEKKESLQNLRYAVFALGSSSYPFFCNFGKNVDNILSDLGAKRITKIELGDELGGQEHTFNEWLPSVYKASCKDFGIELSDDMILPMLDINTWKMGHFRLVGTTAKQRDLLTELSKVHNKKLFTAQIFSRENLKAPEAENQTVLARLTTKNAPLSAYEPGDHIAIFPENPSAVVEPILRRIGKFGINVDEVYQTEYLKNGSWEIFKRFPAATLRQYFTHYLDITTPPTSSFLLLLSQMATDSFDKHRLKKLAEVPDDYETWKSYRYPNLAEILEEFPSIEIDPTLMISELPLLQPRYYSISSSRQSTPDEIHITFTMVSYRTRGNTGPLHHGVCTSFMNTVSQEDILCFIRSAPRFHLPDDSTSPLIMIGAGSGIAPFRSFWHEREAIYENQKKDSSKKTLGPMYLFFGCRQSKLDDIYKSETAPLVKKGVITKVFTALSREPGMQKEYVQHRLEKESEVVLSVLDNGGHIYVCGDAVMATDVRSTIERILSNANKNIEIDDLVDNGHYHEDVFGVLHKK